jgi:site-specific DNA recombinase
MARRSRALRVVKNAGATRVLLYVRVSARMGRAEAKFHSPAVQVDGMRRMSTHAGLLEVAVIDDDIDRSGRTFDRPGIARIRAMVEAKQVDVIAVNDLSRVGRNLSESLTFIKWLRERGVTVISALQPQVDDSPEGQFMLGLWLNIAELQSNQIAAGWSRVIERRARLGLAHSKAAQGYRKDADGQLEIDPVIGPAVTLAARAYARGDPVIEVASNFAAARGKPISRAGLKAMLRNPLYRGRVVVHIANLGKLDVEGVHPPLIDEATWEIVERRMNAERSTPTHHLEPQYSLTGLLKCAYCGGTLQIWHSTEHGKDNPTRRMVCPRRREVGDCPSIGTPLYDGIEAEVLRQIREYAGLLRGNPTARAQQQARVARAGADLPALDRELKATRVAMARLTTRFAKGGLPEAAYDAALADLVEAEQALLAQQERARETSEAPLPNKVVALVDRMMELWPEMTGGERNRALKSILVSATVRRADRWREPEADRMADFQFRW